MTAEREKAHHHKISYEKNSRFVVVFFGELSSAENKVTIIISQVGLYCTCEEGLLCLLPFTK